jgi:Pro-kumamolisin, activation domain/Bacterial Ig-like domain (group 3)
MGILATRLSIQFSLAAVLFALVVPASAEQPPVPPLITQRLDETKRTVLQGNTHPLARPQYDRGAAPPNLPMNRMLLVLKRSPAQESALLSLLDDQQDKASANYHKWLTPENFGKQFGPADQDIQTVTKWLQSHGFQIGKVAKGKNIIEFSGVASQVQEAFHTAIHKYVVNGEEHWANANDPEIPTALTPVVAGVHTLHNFLKKPMIHIAEQKIQAQLVAGKDGKPHVTFPGTPPAYALGPADFATIYNINPLYQSSHPINGSGSAVAVVARSNVDVIYDDVTAFWNVFTVPVTNYVTVFNGSDPGDLGGGEEAEATLDVTWAGAVAPGAVTNLVISATTNTTDGVDLSESYIIDNNLAVIMTESFGSCEASQNSTEAQGYATLAEQAAAQGITYLVASGDSGPEGCDDPDVETVATGPLSVNVLAATPFNLAVGGTMFNEDGLDSKYWNSTNNPNTLESAVSYIPENVWNESCLASQCGDSAGIWASSGGASAFFTKPSWQSGVAGIPNDGWRDVPDVSLAAAADHDPYLLCLEGSCAPDSQGNIFFAAVGGTSASTPSFAGIMALVDQKMGGPQGQAGYVLYKLAGAEKLSSCNASNTTGLPASTCIFNDVTSGNNAVPGEKDYGEPTAPYQSAAGYDLATGLGSVDVTNLVNKWNTVTFRPTTTTLSLSPTTVTHGQPVNVSVTVAAKNGTGTPTGPVALVTSTNLGLGIFTLSAGSVSSTINTLPGGTYTVTARYAGDGTFAASTSAPTPSITVAEENSTTTMSAFTLNANFNFIPFTSGPYGSFVYLRADVKGESGFGTPTGSVLFNDSLYDPYLVGGYTLNSQGNTATPNFLNSPNGGAPTGLFALSPGTHSITGQYSGDLSFFQSSSSPIDVTITSASSTTVAAASPQTQGATLTATVNTSSGGNPPSGTVTFYVDGTQVGTPAPVTGNFALTTLSGMLQGASATGSYLDTALANGSVYTVKAVYSGDANYQSSASSPVNFTLQTDFSFSATETEMDIASPGSSASMLLDVSGVDGYKGTINFSSSSCSGLPAGAACSFNPSSLTGSGEPKLTVSTTAAATGRLRPSPGQRPSLWVALSGVGLAGWLWFGVPAKRRKSVHLLGLLFCTLLITGVGCGGGSSGTSTTPTPPAPPPSAPTPAGTYTVVVTAASGSLKHSVSFTLNVE